MSNQTITSTVNYDDASISGLLNGETIAIDGGALTIDADVRHNQQAAVPGNITISSTLGGSITVDGTQVWELYFDASTGNVPTQNALGSNGVTGTGGATGELTRVWATGSLTPEAAGGAMPATGWIKLRSKTGNFADNEVVTLPGGATITLTGPGRRSWIEVAGAQGSQATVPRLGNFVCTGDWYEIGATDGTDNQTISTPFIAEIPAIQIETASGSGQYEWWANANYRWNARLPVTSVGGASVTITAESILGPGPAYPNGRRVRETAVNSTHVAQLTVTGTNVTAGILSVVAYLKQETRQYVMVQLSLSGGTNRYAALVDLVNGTIVSNSSVGSPTSPSSSISSIGGGWYKVTVSASHSTGNIQGIVAISDSATPTLNASGLPTYTGVTTEGTYLGDFYLENPAAVQYISSTDNRGKYFYSDFFEGKIVLAKRGTANAGIKPASGCKIRIPNIILTNAQALDWSRNISIYYGSALAYAVNISSSGRSDMDKTSFIWRFSTGTTTSFKLTNSAVIGTMGLGTITSTSLINNICFGAAFATAGLVISRTFSAPTITNSRFTTGYNGASLNVANAAGVIIQNCRCDTHGAFGSLAKSDTAAAFAISNCPGAVVENIEVIGSLVAVSTGSGYTLKNIKFADCLNGTTPATGTTGLRVSGAFDVFVDGFYPFDNLPSVNPSARLINLNGTSSGLEFRNFGTTANPWVCTAQNVVNLLEIDPFGIEIQDVTVRRLYASGVSSVPFNSDANQRVFEFVNVHADYANTQSFDSPSTIFKGCRWTPSNTIESNRIGSHWNETFVSATEGRFNISGNEPLAATASQCAGSFSGNSGFTGGGQVSLTKLADTVTWTFPEYAVGHIGIAKATANAMCFNVTGTNTQMLEFEYQIDKNTGNFSAWKHLVNSARRASNGLTGTNTLVIETADESALLRKPQIGDYIQSVGLKLPAGTTISNVSGTTITTSNNFTVDANAGELFYFWKDVASEVVSATTGFKLKVRVKVNTESTSTLLSYVNIPTDTTANDQLTAYALPFDGTGVISNIESGSRMQIYNVTTATELYNGVVSGTSYTYGYYVGNQVSAGNTLRIRIAKLGKLPQELIAVATSTGFSAAANALADEIYVSNGIDGSTVTEFTPDYPNIQVDINDPDQATTVQRVYAWLRYIETTSSGIAQWFNAVDPTDEVNYEINTAVLNLKLDNTQATPVVIGGGRLYRSDGATIIATLSSSIHMDPNRVYSIDSITPADVWSYSTRTLSSTGNSGVASAVRTELATELGRVDVAVSSRNSTAPDNSGIAAIKAKTDNLPALPAAKGDIPTATQVASQVRTELTTELGRIDVATSTRLASSGYTAPDNASITAIKAKTDNLPAAPAAIGDIPTASQVATQVRSELTTELGRIDATISSRNATVPDNAGIAAIKAKTDNLPALPAAKGDVPTASQVATQVRSELTTELGRIDVATSTRLASSGYTAPDNAGIAAIKAKTDNLPALPAAKGDIPTASQVATQVRTELTTELGRIDVATSTRLASSGYTAPDNSSITAIKAKTDNLPAAPAATGDIPTASQVASQVRTELTTELGRIDVTVSSRNATAPDNAGIAAIKAKTDNLPASPASEGKVQEAVDAAKLAVALSA